MNLLVLLLITYHGRAIIQSLEEKNLVMLDVLKNFATSGLIWDLRNYQTLLACILSLTFVMLSYFIEKMAGNGVSSSLVSFVSLDNFRSSS